MRPVLLLLLCLILAPPAWADDPLHSVLWESVRETVFAGQKVVFDDSHVQVFTPASVEDNMNVPVAVAVSGLGPIKAVAVIADHNPVPLALMFYPVQALASFETRIKVQEATPIRAAAQTQDGIWHVGGLRVDAAGGGCTLPAGQKSATAWDSLNEVQAQAWPRPDGTTRLRLRISHPMDTGFVAGTPVFYLQSLVLRGPSGTALARLEIHEPVATNPTFTVNLITAPPEISLDGVDSDGNRIDAHVRVRP